MISKKHPILVTGGNGYIGSVLVEHLLEHGYKVRVFDKFFFGQEVLKDLSKNKNLELVKGDVCNIYSLVSALQDARCVVHLAGIVGDAAGSVDPKLTHHVNVVSTRILRDSVKALKIPRLIFASSCSVYGITKNVSTERSRLYPISIYAKTKIETELDLLSDRSPNFHPSILRFATVFGHSRKPRFDLVANLFTAQAFYNEPLIVSNGKQWRPFIHVKDLARAVQLVMESPEEKVSRQIFNVGDEVNHMRIDELARLVKSIVENDKPVSIVKQSIFEDKRDYRVSFKKIQKVLNFKSSIDLPTGIEEMYKNFKLKTYRLPYHDSFYSSLGMTKIYLNEFNTSKYKKEHLTEIY